MKRERKSAKVFKVSVIVALLVGVIVMTAPNEIKVKIAKAVHLIK